MSTAADIRVAYAGTRVLVTGATGFIGSRLVAELVECGAEVVALTRHGAGVAARLGELGERLDYLAVDLTDADAVSAAVHHIDPQVVFHLATHYAVDNSADLAEMIDVNVKAGALLAGACANRPALRMFVNAGTCAEYGDFRGEADEETRLSPNNVYASTKSASTLLLQQLGRDLGVPLTTLRLYNIYGEFERPTRIVPYVALSLIRGRRVELTAGEQAKDYSYLGDIVDAFLHAGASPNAAGEIINIGSGVTVTIREIVETIAAQFGDEALGLIDFGAKEYRPDEMWFQGTNIRKATRLLGWRAETPLGTGIADVVEWYRQNADAYYADF